MKTKFYSKTMTKKFSKQLPELKVLKPYKTNGAVKLYTSEHDYIMNFILALII